MHFKDTLVLCSRYIYIFSSIYFLLFVILSFFSLLIVIFLASTSSIVHYFYKNKCLGIEQQKRRSQAKRIIKKKTLHKNCNHPHSVLCFFIVCPLNIVIVVVVIILVVITTLYTRYRISFASFFAFCLLPRLSRVPANSPNSTCIPRATQTHAVCVCV